MSPLSDPPTADPVAHLAPADPERRAAPERVPFTSNIVGPLLLLRDLLAFSLAVPVALLLYAFIFGDRLVASVHVFAFVAMLATFLLMRTSKDSYLLNLFSMSERNDTASFDALMSGLVAAALIFLSGMVEYFSRGLTLFYVGTTALLLSASRWPFNQLLKKLAEKGRIGQRIAFYGADEESIESIRQVLAHGELQHLRFVGIADDRARVDIDSGLDFLGGSSDLAQLARAGKVDQVLISVRNLPRERLQEIMEQLSEVCVDISLIPTQAIELFPHYQVRLLGSLPVLTMWQRPWRDVSGILKRSEDLVLASLALILVAPVMLLAAALIKLTSKGPVFFVQPRIGFNNEVIHVLKFRSMYTEKTDLVGHETTTRNDPRVTPVGRILRRLSIDELPQLLNVLRGDMAIVGPRPHATHMRVGDRYYQEAVKGYAGRHRVRPGITGLAQVKGLRGEIRTMDRAVRRVQLDQQYIDNWSVWLDLWIIVLTARAIFVDSDAY